MGVSESVEPRSGAVDRKSDEREIKERAVDGVDSELLQMFQRGEGWWGGGVQIALSKARDMSLYQYCPY